MNYPNEADSMRIVLDALGDGQTNITVDMLTGDIFTLVGLLQFAERGLPPAHGMRSRCVTLGRAFQEALVTATGHPQLNEVMEMGWNRAFDVDEHGDFIEEATDG